jgi:hypothetical protein
MKIVNYLYLLSFIFFIEESTSAVLPTLPQVFIQTDYIPPTNGKIISVSTSAEFSAALLSSNLGDIIELEAGKTFTGTFFLPNKTSGSGWIYIRSSAYSKLPLPCNRVSPSDVSNMPKIVAKAGSEGAIHTASKAHHFRFIGIEFAPVDNNFLYNVIIIGNGETSISNLPNNIVFDRCYIHGDPKAGSRRGILMNGNYISVIDSYISDCKEDGADSQALASYSATGPMKIVNNYLEGAGENVMFGGADPSIPNAVMSDIEIRCNLFFKPLSWMKELWDIKNLLEFKNAQRVLVEGNRFENCWPNVQNGFALLLTPRNQNNTAPWSVVQDITIRMNTFINIAQGINLSGYDSPNKSERTSRILIQNNVLNVTNLGTGGDGRLFQILNGSTDVVIDHNIGFCTNAYLVADGSPKTDNFEFRNNIVSYATYGFIGSGTANANTTLSAYFNPNWLITKNVVIGGSATNYPVGSYFPSNQQAVGFVDYANGDYRLKSSSPYKNFASDGKDIGADIDSINIVSKYNCGEISSIEEEKSINQFGIFPNPASSVIEFNDKKVEQFEISNILGQVVCKGDNTSKIDISNLQNGTYFLKTTINNHILFRIFVKE